VSRGRLRFRRSSGRRLACRSPRASHLSPSRIRAARTIASPADVRIRAPHHRRHVCSFGRSRLGRRAPIGPPRQVNCCRGRCRSRVRSGGGELSRLCGLSRSTTTAFSPPVCAFSHRGRAGVGDWRQEPLEGPESGPSCAADIRWTGQNRRLMRSVDPRTIWTSSSIIPVAIIVVATAAAIAKSSHADRVSNAIQLGIIVPITTTTLSPRETYQLPWRPQLAVQKRRPIDPSNHPATSLNSNYIPLEPSSQIHLERRSRPVEAGLAPAVDEQREASAPLPASSPRTKAKLRGSVVQRV
jgi:hypothetical protein